MMGDRQKHIILVRQLMALAESTRFEGERASALAKAKETMERYSLTEADITGRPGRPEHPLCPGCRRRHPPNVQDMKATVTFTNVTFSGSQGNTIRLDAWWKEAEDE